jgi:hypothetical protein
MSPLQARQVKKIHPGNGSDHKKFTFQWVNVFEDILFAGAVTEPQRNIFANHVAENILFYFDGALKGIWGQSQSCFTERCRYSIQIGSDLTGAICGPQWNKMTAQNRRYVNFQLATTLLHELAHVAWYRRWWDEIVLDDTARTEEAVLSHDEEQVELGQSWERWFFGGALQPLQLGRKPSDWLGYTFASYTRDTGNEESVGYPDCTHGSTAVPAYSINRFFQKERWAKHKDGSELLTIDLTPLNSLTIDNWDVEVDESYMNRLNLNHGNQADPRPRLPEEF